MTRPHYSRAPIRSLDALGLALRTPVSELIRLGTNSTTRYKSVVRFKKDGTARYAWNAEPALKRVQQNIKTAILQAIEFPRYLHGGIRDHKHPRDYARNAGIHTGQVALISEDVKDFFPSISIEQVERIWREFFRFPPEVARCLAKLTTRDGVVPQGANTSNHLANLVFRDEQTLVEHLDGMGFRYSRLTDDITISAAKRVSPATKSAAINSVYGMMARAGCRPKRRKHVSSGQGNAMKVNGLVVNVRVALPRNERRAIRAQVNQHIQGVAAGSALDPNDPSLLGRLGKLHRFHPMQGKRLKLALIAAIRSRLV